MLLFITAPIKLLSAALLMICLVSNGITVEPLLSDQLSKSRYYFQLNTINKTPVKPLLSDHGHLLIVPMKVIYCVLPLLSGHSKLNTRGLALFLIR